MDTDGRVQQGTELCVVQGQVTEAPTETARANHGAREQCRAACLLIKDLETYKAQIKQPSRRLSQHARVVCTPWHAIVDAVRKQRSRVDARRQKDMHGKTCVPYGSQAVTWHGRCTWAS